LRILVLRGVCEMVNAMAQTAEMCSAETDPGFGLGMKGLGPLCCDGRLST